MPPTDKLSRRERDIMDVLYGLGDNASADEIRDKLTDPPTYSAVRAMLAKLEAKGVIRHRAEGLRYVYSPVTSRTAAQKKAIRDRKSTRLNSSHLVISYAVFCLKKKKKNP